MAESDTDIKSEDVEPSDSFSPEFYRMNQDLKLGRLGIEIALERSMAEMELDFDDKLAEGKPLIDFDLVLARVPEYTGLTREQYLDAAQFQGLNINDFTYRVGQMGQPIRQVLDAYQEQEVPAAFTPEERIMKYKRAQLPDRKKAIVALGAKRIDSGESRAAKEIEARAEGAVNLKVAALPRADRHVDFRQIKDLGERQREVARSIYDAASDGGLSANQIQAMLANGMAESRLNPFISNTADGEDSHGVFQFNRNKGEGVGFTVAQLQDPAFQTKMAVEAIKSRDELKFFRDNPNADPKVLTEHFMEHFERPAPEPEGLAKRLAYLTLAKKLGGEAAKLSVKGKQTNEVVEAGKAELLRQIYAAPAIKARVEEGDDALKAVAKETDPINVEFKKEFKKYADPKIADDPERARLVQAALANHDTENPVRTTFAEDAFDSLYTVPRDYDIKKIAGRLNMPPAEFLDRAKDPKNTREYELLQEIDRYNRKFLALYRTFNKAGSPLFVSYEWIDPQNWMQEDRPDENSFYGKRLLSAWMRSRVELMGLDSTGTPVYRLPSPTMQFIEKMDPHLGLLAGGIEGARNRKEGQGFLSAIKEGTITGLKEDRDFTKMALSTDMARSNAAVAVGVGVTGLAVDVLTPDPLFFAAKGIKASRGFIAGKLAARKVPGLMAEMGTASIKFVDTSAAMQRVADAIESGDLVRAESLIDEAQEAAGAAQTAEQAARRQAPSAMDKVDTADAGFAIDVGVELPGLVGKSADDLSDLVGLTESGIHQDNLHVAALRLAARGTSDSQLAAYSDLFGLTQKLGRLKTSLKQVQEGKLSGPNVAMLRRVAIKPATDKIIDAITASGKSEKILSSAAYDDLIEYLVGSDAARDLASSHIKFATETTNRLNKVDAVAKTNFVRVLQKQLNESRAATDKVIEFAAAERDPEKLMKGLAQLSRAIGGQAESRAAAHAFFRQGLADEFKIVAEPITAAATSRFEELGIKALSLEGTALRRSIEKEFPAMRQSGQSTVVAHMIDALFRSRADKLGRDISLVYAENLDVTRKFIVRNAAEEASDLSKAASGAPKAAPSAAPVTGAPPAPTPSTAATTPILKRIQFEELDEGLVRLTSNEVETAAAKQPKFSLSAVTDELRLKTVKQLKSQAKELGIAGVSKTKKADLVDIIAARLESTESLSTQFLDRNPAIKASVVALNQKLDDATKDVTKLQRQLDKTLSAGSPRLSDVADWSAESVDKLMVANSEFVIDVPSRVALGAPTRVFRADYLDELIKKAQTKQQALIDEAQKFRANIAENAGIDFLPGLVFGVRDNTLYVQSIELPMELRGKGIGNALYLAALRRAKNVGLNFSSDVNPSPQAERIYQRLIDQGIPFSVSEIEDVGGKTLRRYALTKANLAQVDDLLLDPVKAAKAPIPTPDVVPAAAKLVEDAIDPAILSGGNPLVVEALQDGSSIIRAMRETVGFDDFVAAVSQLVRKELSEPQMAEVVKWIRSKGVNISHKGSKFVSDNPAEIDAANDLFAKAYTQFLRTDVSPTDGTQKGFDIIKDALVSRYAGAKNAAVDGVQVQISPEVDSVLRDILRFEAPKRSPVPNMLSVARRYILDNLPKIPTDEFYAQLSRQATRLGTPVDAKELERVVTTALKGALESKKPLAEIEIKLPVMLSLGGPSPKAKTIITASEFSEAVMRFTQRSRESARVTGTPIKAAYEGVTETTASGVVDQAVMDSSAFANFARFVFIGDDALKSLRAFDPDMRKDIMAGVRMTQQTIGDTVTLITEGELDKLVRYMAGDPMIQFRYGRFALSAGHDKMASTAEGLKSTWANFLEQYPKMHATLRGAFEAPGGVAKFLKDNTVTEQYVEAFNKLVWGRSAKGEFISDTFRSVGLTPGGTLTPEHLLTLQTLLYHSNAVKFEGKLFREALEASGEVFSSEVQFRSLYQKLDEMYPFNPRIKDSAPIANRVTALIAAHGQAHKQMLVWADLGIVADANTAIAYKKWVQGEEIADPAMLAKVQTMFNVSGFKPEFMEASKLYGLNFYVPEAARKKLALAIEQSVDDSIQEALRSGDVLETLGKGARGAASTRMLATAWTYRYIKTRMIRGHYLLKSRYFWMNTYDHFNQMALIGGYRPALISTIRMMPQNLLANPLGQSIVTVASRLGAEKAPAIVAQQLQKAGDKGAQWASGMMRASKWNGSVNAVLEAQPGFVMSNGVPVEYRLLRDIFIEEGIAGSFDTAELGVKIRYQGQMYLNKIQKEAMREGIEVPLADLLKALPKITADIAEAWGERERFGAALTLVEMGVDPRTAARLTIDALYDYAGSMSKMDRNFLMNVFFPFWAFQKNANRQLLDVVFSPEGAYRLGVMRRAWEKGPHLLNEVLYQDMVDPFGIDVDSMGEQEKMLYGNLKNTLATKYGSLYSIPDEDRQAITMILTGRNFVDERGRRHLSTKSVRYSELKAEVKGMMNSPEGRLSEGAINKYYVPRPHGSQTPTYTDTQSKLMLPYRYNAASAFFDEQRKTTSDRQFTSILLPEQTYKASYKHLINGVRVFGAIGEEIRKQGLRYLIEPDDGSDLFTLKESLKDFVEFERGMFVKDLAAMTNISESSVPLRLATDFALMLTTMNFEILAVDPKDDPILKVLQFSKAQKARQAGDKSVVVPDSPYIQNGILVPKKNFYLQAGMGRMLFENSPLGELNQLMLQMEQSPVEQHAGIRGEIQRIVRVAGLARVSDVLPSKAAQSGSYELINEAGGEMLDKKDMDNLRYLGPIGKFGDGNKADRAEKEVADRAKRLDDQAKRLKDQDEGEMEIDI